MAKMTLLDIVQDILNEMKSDPVNSVTETEESVAVAQIVKSTYYSIIDSRDWPHLHTFSTLEAATTPSTYKVHVFIPDRVTNILWLKYNKSTTGAYDYTDVYYEDPKEFLERLNARDSTASTVDTVTDYTGTKLFVRNDKMPEYFTIISDRHLTTGDQERSNDQYIIFDSYDSDVESNINATRVQAEVIIEPTWSLSDTFVPDLPAQAFTYLLEEAKSTAFAGIKQVANAKSEQKARNHKTRLARTKHKTKRTKDIPDYGR